MTDTGKPTSYFQVQREREQALEMDALTDGHSALMLQSQRLANRGPEYPRQPNHPFAIDAPTEPPLGRAIDQVADMTKVEQR
jgi:hypothetical protein